MNILLVNPSQRHVYNGMFSMSQVPLGLAYIAAVLKSAGNNVKVVDIDLSLGNRLTFKESLREGEVDLVGITTTTPTYNNALSLAKEVKQACNAYVVLGGIHVTMLPEESASSPYVDFVVKGEGEETIVELVRALEKRTDLNHIAGLVFKQKNKIINNDPRYPIEDLDSLPFPARELFKHNKYIYPDSLHSKVAPMMTSRGCFGKCSYCLAHIISGDRCRFRSAKNVVDEIQLLKEDYGIKEVHFWDDNFIGMRKRVFDIRDELKRRKIRLKYAFPNGVRADFVNEEVLTALEEMGTYSIAIGVESGNQEILNSVNKNIALSKIKDTFRILKKLKFESWAFFMFGLPGENAETIRRTIKFAKELDPDVAKFHIFKPFPGSALFNHLHRHGLIVDFNYDNYGLHSGIVHKLEGFQDGELYKWQKIAYRKFYLRPQKIFSHLLRLKSLFRIKLNLIIGVSILRKMVK